MRIALDLPNTQIIALRAIQERDNISRADAIRQAVANYIGEYTVQPSAFGAWKKEHSATTDDTLVTEHKLRSEWYR